MNELEKVREEIAKIVNVELSKPSKYLGYDKGYGWGLEPIADQILSIKVGNITLKELIELKADGMTEQMQIQLSEEEQQIVNEQCQACQLWDDKLGCQFYPLTPAFMDNRPASNCVQKVDPMKEEQC